GSSAWASVSRAAIRVKVFLTTLYSVPLSRSLRRRRVIWATVSPRKSVTNTALEDCRCSRISSTAATFSGLGITSPPHQAPRQKNNLQPVSPQAGGHNRSRRAAHHAQLLRG